jgi:hypothetical protein
VRSRLVFLATIIALALPVAAQDHAAGVQTAFARAQHLKRGINVSHWFSQSDEDYSAYHTDHDTTPADIALMAKMGFDNVRLSIEAMALEQTPVGADGLNADFTPRLDKAVDAILANGMDVLIDVHPEDMYKQQMRTSDDSVDRFIALWGKLAAHYAGRDPDRVFFEILNEPEIADARWAGIQQRAAVAIREVAPHNTIIAAGGNYSDIQNLLALHPLPDGNVIYNFHFYDPHEFTHQGAGWGVPWWKYLHNIPYPPTESTMQESLKELPDPANRYALENYWLDHWDAHRIQLLMDEGAQWGKDNHVPLICNEFGVFRDHSDPASRAAWIHDVRTALEADGIGWAMWDFHGSFGVVIQHSGQPAKVDAPIAAALGLPGN